MKDPGKTRKNQDVPVQVESGNDKLYDLFDLLEQVQNEEFQKAQRKTRLKKTRILSESKVEQLLPEEKIDRRIEEIKQTIEQAIQVANEKLKEIKEVSRQKEKETTAVAALDTVERQYKEVQEKIIDLRIKEEKSEITLTSSQKHILEEIQKKQKELINLKNKLQEFISINKINVKPMTPILANLFPTEQQTSKNRRLTQPFPVAESLYKEKPKLMREHQLIQQEAQRATARQSLEEQELAGRKSIKEQELAGSQILKIQQETIKTLESEELTRKALLNEEKTSIGNIKVEQLKAEEELARKALLNEEKTGIGDIKVERLKVEETLARENIKKESDRTREIQAFLMKKSELNIKELEETISVMEKEKRKLAEAISVIEKKKIMLEEETSRENILEKFTSEKEKIQQREDLNNEEKEARKKLLSEEMGEIKGIKETQLKETEEKPLLKMVKWQDIEKIR